MIDVVDWSRSHVPVGEMQRVWVRGRYDEQSARPEDLSNVVEELVEVEEVLDKFAGCHKVELVSDMSSQTWTGYVTMNDRITGGPQLVDAILEYVDTDEVSSGLGKPAMERSNGYAGCEMIDAADIKDPLACCQLRKVLIARSNGRSVRLLQS